MHYYRRFLFLAMASSLLLSCQSQQRSDQNKDISPDVRLLGRIGRATTRYRNSLDLTSYAQSAVERSLAERHWQINRDILKLEFSQVKLQMEELAASKEKPAEAKAEDAGQTNRRYERAAGEAEKLRSNVESLAGQVAAAEQKLKQARDTTRAQSELNRARQALQISRKELSLSEANLKLIEMQRKESDESTEETKSLGDKIVLLEKEALGTDGDSSPVKWGAQGNTSPGSGLTGALRSWWNQYDKGQVLEQAQQRANRMVDDFKSAQSENQKLRKRLRDEHRALNREIRQLYSQAGELLKQAGQDQQTGKLLADADSKMAASLSYSQRRQTASQLQDIFEKKVLLATEDADRLASWIQVASDSRARALNRLLRQLASLLGMIAIVFIVAHYLKKIPGRLVKEEKSAYYFRKLIGFAAWLIVILMVIFNAAGGIGSISAVIGLAGAGLAIALQDPIVSLVGWFLIIGKYGISVGDRIEINGVKGDVADVGMLRIAVMEVGNWLSGEQSTGRMVFFPNSFIFKGHFFNYSTADSFVWDEVHILVTYESPWKKARDIILKVAQEASRDVVQRARESQDRLARRFNINLGSPDAYAYVSIADSGVDLVLRFLSEIKLRRTMRDRICSEILEAFEKEKDIQLAYPTQRQLTETRIIANAADA